MKKINIENLSDKQLTGQRIIAGFNGTSFDSHKNSTLKFLIDTVKVGGIILFSRNIESPDQVEKLCTRSQEYAASCGQPPLLIAIDQEGGTVARLKKPFTCFPNVSEMKDPAEAVNFGKITAKELYGIGVNMNLAPVMDVAPCDIKSVMADRSFGHDPLKVAEMGCLIIEHLQKRGIMACAKHFPGIGRTVADSHHVLPDSDIDMEDLDNVDLVPFKAAIRAGVASIMISHIRYTRIDPLWPASLSAKLAGDLLRDKMGFDGLVMTDDLDMGAVTPHYDIETAVKNIMDARIDIALICHEGPNAQKAFETILEKSGKDSAESRKHMESVERIMSLKRKFLKC